LRGLVVFLLFILSGISAAKAESCNRFAVAITTTPVLYQWTSALEKAQGLLDKPPRQSDTVLLGDSLLAFWPRDLADTQFGKGRVWNFAVGGSRTQHILWQLDRLSSAASVKPREVIVLIGTNNLSDEKLPACAIIEGIKTVVARTRAIWPGAVIHVMGIPPRGSDFHFRDRDRKTINGALRAWIAARPDEHYFEVDDLVMTCGQYAGVTVASADNTTLTGSRCENYADDFGHFRRPGYDVIFEALRGS
jgi:lysophospholipase L1-like esterase